MTRRLRRPRRPLLRSARFWVPAIIGMAVLAGIGAVVLGAQALAVRDDLEEARATVVELQAAATERNVAALPALSEALADSAGDAVEPTAQPLWRVGEWVPVLGENLRGVRLVAESIDGLSRNLVSPGVGLVSTFSLTRDPATGGFDIAPILEARDVLAASTRGVTRNLEELEGAATHLMIPQVADAVEEYTVTLQQVSNMLTQFHAGIVGAGELLGVDGPRTIVAAFLNNAETAALGGGPAAQSLMRVEAGRVEKLEQVTSGDFPQGIPLDVAIDPSAEALYNDILTRNINGAMSRPDFPTAGRILEAQWKRLRGLQIDGVISLDPIALSHILAVTGPVSVPTGEVLDSGNVVATVLNQAYFRYDGYTGEADDFFKEAATTVFDRLMSGDYDVWTMANALVSAAEAGSLMMWSADPETESLLDGTRLQGTLPGSNEGDTVLGTFFRDRSSSKIDFYLRTESVVTTNACDVENPSYTVETRLWFDIPQGVELPGYVDSQLYPFYRTEVFAYGPVGASVTEAAVLDPGTATETGPSVVDLERPAVKYIVDLVPGQTGVVRTTFQGVPGEYGPTTLRVTPLVHPTVVTLAETPCG